MQAFDSALPMLLNRTLDSVMPPYRELFARYNLTEPQWRILRVLWENEKVTSVELSHRTLLATASLVGILDRLEKKQLISRLRSTTDRRQVYIRPTSRGRELEALVTPQVSAIHAQIENGVSASEWAALQRTLEKISRHCSANTQRADHPPPLAKPLN